MSSEGRREGWVWIVSGPSGSGKTSLCEALLADPAWGRRLLRSVSCTTRPLRPGEKEGRDYRSVPTKTFLRMLRRGAFLEHEEIFGYHYGTPRSAAVRARRQGRELLCCVDVKGARSIRRAFPKGSSSVFILPPHRRALEARLRKRSTESKKDIARRLARVKMELAEMKAYDYIIVNDKFREALGALKAVLTARRHQKSYVLRSLGKTDR